MMHLKGMPASRIPDLQKYHIVVQTFRTPPTQFGISCVPQKLHVHFHQSSYIPISL